MRIKTVMACLLLYLPALRSETPCFIITDRGGNSIDDATVNILDLKASSKPPAIADGADKGSKAKCYEVEARALVKATISRKGFVSMSE